MAGFAEGGLHLCAYKGANGRCAAKIKIDPLAPYCKRHAAKVAVEEGGGAEANPFETNIAADPGTNPFPAAASTDTTQPAAPMPTLELEEDVVVVEGAADPADPAAESSIVVNIVDNNNAPPNSNQRAGVETMLATRSSSSTTVEPCTWKSPRGVCTNLAIAEK